MLSFLFWFSIPAAFAALVLYGVQRDNEACSLLGFIVGIISLIVVAIVPIVTYVDSLDVIKRVNMTRTTIEMARTRNIGTLSALEDAALTMKIAEINAELAARQYWRNMWHLEGFTPQAFLDLKPIK